MKVLLLGDTHFGARNDSPIFHDFFDQFYTEFFFPYIKANQVDHIIQLGDVFDRRKYINFQSLHRAKKYFFDPLAQTKLPVDFIVGNHDTFFRNTNEVNSLGLLLREYNFNLWKAPADINVGGLSMLLVPWINTESEQEALEALKMTKSQIAIGHFEIQGFEMYRGAVNEAGLSMDVFDKFDAVYSGHFHHKSSRKNIHYVGTPYEMTWSDFGDPHGFHILDTNTREVEYVENPYKIFIKMWYDDNGKEMNECILDDYSHFKNKMIKMIVTNKTNPYWFDMVIDKLEKAGVADLQVVDDHLNLNLEDDQDIVDQAEDTLTILNKFIQQGNFQVDRERLTKLVQDLYNEALTVE